MNDMIVERPKRWDEPFCDAMHDALVKVVLASKHFDQMQATNFANNISLSDIIKNDCRIVKFDQNQVMVSANAYLNSAFILLSGTATMVMSTDANGLNIGQTKQKKATVKESFIEWLKRPSLAESRSHISAVQLIESNKDYAPRDPNNVVAASSYNPILENLEQIIDESGSETKALKTGDIFGESAVLGRNEMQHMVVANSPVTVLEIRWQGLRELRRREKGFKEMIDKLYRDNGLYEHLVKVPLFRHLPKQAIRELTSCAQFEVHGEFEWHNKFQVANRKSIVEDDIDHLIESEPIISEEKSSIDGLLLIKNGFARVSRKINHGQYTFGHLSAGDLFGLEELHESWQSGAPALYNCSLRALGYTDIIRIPNSWLQQHLFSSKDPEVLAVLQAHLDKEAQRSYVEGVKPKQSVDRKMTEFFVEQRFINGTKTMMIDLERCVRCDDCVTACASVHDNNPRFVRHGARFENNMVANACMHCEDPVCMIGCPTGAIHRAEDGVVSINDTTCIGCSTCANSCPYNNIRMVPVQSPEGQPYRDDKNKPIMKATKCDLCTKVPGGPACVRACSHDAITRIDIKDMGALSDWVNRK